MEQFVGCLGNVLKVFFPMSDALTVILILVATFLVADRLTWLMIRLAPALGLMDQPGERRIHAKAVPRAGGIAVFGAMLAGFGLATWSGVSVKLGSVLLSGYWMPSFLIGAGLLIVVGVVDDRLDLSPWWKIAAQVAAASVVFFANREGFGHIYTWTLPWWIDWMVNVAWIVVLVNAFNLIDGMDGVCAGLGVISIGILTVFAGVGRTPGDMLLLAVMIVALVAFLRFNFHPAKIFLGDAGSMLIGFFVATAGTTTVGRHAVIAGMLLPLLVAGVPLFDVLLAVWRRSARRIAHRDREDGKSATRIFDADRDHLHHRLLSWGLGQRQAAVLIYALSAVIAVLAVVPMLGGGNLLAFSLVGLALIGLVGLRYVAPVEFLESSDGLRAFVRRPRGRSWMVLTYFLYDACVLTASTWLALWLVRRATMISQGLRMDVLVCCLFVGCGLLALRFARAHTRRWSRATVQDFAETMAWLVCGALLSVGMVSVFLEDLSFRMALIHVTALAFSIVAVLLPRSLSALVQESALDVMHRRRWKRGAGGGRPTLIYGAGDLGELFVSHVRLSESGKWSDFIFVGYLDDDPNLKDRWMQGFRIFGGLNEIEQIVNLQHVKCVIVTMGGLAPDRRTELFRQAERLGIEVREWVSDLDTHVIRGA